MAVAQLEFETIQRTRIAGAFLNEDSDKSGLLPVLSMFVLKEFRNYVEPFLDGGSLFRATRHGI